jgi:hypothetical protein
MDCPNEDHGPSICFYIDRVRWRPPASADEMRRGLGDLVKSVFDTQARGGGDGNGPEQPLLRKLNAERTAPLAHPSRPALLQRASRQYKPWRGWRGVGCGTFCQKATKQF